MMEAAEDGKARWRGLADRVAQYYSPVVHATALLTFVGWAMAGADWHSAISIAIAVLIITCPCALGLAVPMVQVVAARRLFEAGVMVKDGAAMERLAEIDAVIFDKTGTLTRGQPALVNAASVDPRALAIASALAAHSKHPVSKALSGHGGGSMAFSIQHVEEVPGSGIEARLGGRTYRLGRADWALADGPDFPHEPDAGGTVLGEDGRRLADFAFEDHLRTGARHAVAALRRAGLQIAVLSGDNMPAVAGTAARLGVSDYSASVFPADKVARLAALAKSGRKVLMVGDGLNDAPALAAAHVSMAPATAADVGRSAADFVFLGESSHRRSVDLRGLAPCRCPHSSEFRARLRLQRHSPAGRHRRSRDAPDCGIGDVAVVSGRRHERAAAGARSQERNPGWEGQYGDSQSRSRRRRCCPVR